MGISFVTTAIARRSQFHQSVLSSHLTAASLKTQVTLQHVSQFVHLRGFDPVTAGEKAHALLCQLLQQQAALLSYVDVFHVMGNLFLAITPLILFMHRSGDKPAAASQR